MITKCCLKRDNQILLKKTQDEWSQVCTWSTCNFYALEIFRQEKSAIIRSDDIFILRLSKYSCGSLVHTYMNQCGRAMSIRSALHLNSFVKNKSNSHYPQYSITEDHISNEN